MDWDSQNNQINREVKMDIYVRGQVLHRAYVAEDRGAYTIEVEIKSIHGDDCVEIISQYREMLIGCADERGDRKGTSGNEYRCTQQVQHLVDHYAPTPIEALEKLRAGKYQTKEALFGQIAEIEAEIRLITREIEESIVVLIRSFDINKGTGLPESEN